MADKIKLEEGQMYAVNTGTYKGSNIIIVKTHDSHVECLDVPDMTNRVIDISDIHTGISNNIIELLETLPVDILDVCSKQYEKNINNR